MHATLKIVYVVSQRKDRRYYCRVGAAFVNSDGSLHVKLDAIPVSGELEIRDYAPRADRTRALPGDPTSQTELL